MFNEFGERTLRVSDVFYSITGEGPLAGVPSVFVKLFGCNFTCRGFSNPSYLTIPYSGLEDKTQFKSEMGCDSMYAWHPAYKNASKVYTISELAQAIVNVLPEIHSYDGVPHMPILAMTGGEPTIHQSGIAELLEHPLIQNFSKLLIETNAALDLKPRFIRSLTAWLLDGEVKRDLIWACSPKLKASGEPQERAIRPTIICDQRGVDSMQYLKFVSDGSEESFDEIRYVFDKYNTELKANDLTPIDPFAIYVMSAGSTLEQQLTSQKVVAAMCLKYGFNFCARVQCYVFGTAVGT
jgi:organic radical activating enzyme